MQRLRRTVRLIGAAGLLGALLIGVGGRLVMRLLALRIGQPGVFSWGGSGEILLYGALVGTAGGAIAVAAVPLLRRNRWFGGMLLGLIVYAGTVLTLPGHIAQTATPFAAIMPPDWLLFGACFLLWGVAVAGVAARG